MKVDAGEFGFFPPLGLGYLAATIQRDGIRVEIHDLMIEGHQHVKDLGGDLLRVGLPEKKIELLLSEKSPELVGISANFSAFAADSVALARIVRRCLPESTIVMGGVHATYEPRSLLASGVVDAVVLGEGEYIFRDIAREMDRGKRDAARGLPGTVWRIDGQDVDNGFPAPITDLDEIPFPAYDLMPMEQYIHQWDANFAFALRLPVGHMITTRGCLYNCRFCSNRRPFKNLRARGVGSVVREMEMLVEKFGIREFHFHDDCFMVSRKRVQELCYAIIAKGWDIRWQASQGINSIWLDSSLLELMQRSGMYRVGFPIESGCHKTLKFIRKPIDLQKVQRLIEDCNRLGIYTWGCFMIGFPEETAEDIQETVDFLLRSGLDHIKLSIVQPHPGSELYTDFQRLGLLGGEGKHGSTYFHTLYDTKHLKAEELNSLRSQALAKFSGTRLLRMLTPKGFGRHLLPKLRSWESTKYLFRTGWSVLRESYRPRKVVSSRLPRTTY